VHPLLTFKIHKVVPETRNLTVHQFDPEASWRLIFWLRRQRSTPARIDVEAWCMFVEIALNPLTGVLTHWSTRWTSDSQAVVRPGSSKDVEFVWIWLQKGPGPSMCYTWILQIKYLALFAVSRIATNALRKDKILDKRLFPGRWHSLTVTVDSVRGLVETWRRTDRRSDSVWCVECVGCVWWGTEVNVVNFDQAYFAPPSGVWISLIYIYSNWSPYHHVSS